MVTVGIVIAIRHGWSETGLRWPTSAWNGGSLEFKYTEETLGNGLP